MSDYSQTSYPSGAPAGHSAGADDKKMVIIAIVGAAIALIGSLINWSVTDKATGDIGGVKGTDGDGVISLITALAAAALFIGAMVAKKHILHAVGAVVSLVTLVIGGIAMANPDRVVVSYFMDEGAPNEKAAEKVAEQLEFSAGPGVYMVLVGALLSLVCGFLAFKKANSGR
ncbi:hypothetical protein ACQUSR_18830 [Streptomyces sp. P1-3]|uniref:hypothetical protein n=1 Tax=Streptomyces sp. P1-3 TaxID=3421658 RepID=UPI003D36557E